MESLEHNWWYLRLIGGMTHYGVWNITIYLYLYISASIEI